MRTNSEVQLNVKQFNIPTIVSVLGVGVTILTYASGIKSDAVELRTRIDQLEQYRVSRSATTDRNFDEMQVQLSKFNDVPHRLGVVENQVTVVNARIDRFTELLSTTLEAIRKDIANVATKVEVLGSKLDQAERRAQASPTGGSLRLGGPPPL
jgi:hypothetical protein